MHVCKHKCISPKIMPIQTNSYDCGIFIIKVSKYCKSFGAINELVFGNTKMKKLSGFLKKHTNKTLHIQSKTKSSESHSDMLEWIISRISCRYTSGHYPVTKSN